MSPLMVPAALAALWVLSAIAFVFIVVREIRTRPDTPPADPAFCDPGLTEDSEVAFLDSIYEMPTAAPRAW